MFIELDFDKPTQKVIYDKVVEATREIYRINDRLVMRLSKSEESVLLRKKLGLMAKIEELVAKVYRLEF